MAEPKEEDFKIGSMWTVKEWVVETKPHTKDCVIIIKDVCLDKYYFNSNEEMIKYDFIYGVDDIDPSNPSRSYRKGDITHCSHTKDQMLDWCEPLDLITNIEIALEKMENGF